MHERMEQIERVEGLSFKPPTNTVSTITDEQSKFKMLVHGNELRISIMASAAE